MGNWNYERRCGDCGKITRKRKHQTCPSCGGELLANSKALINNIKPIITPDILIVHHPDLHTLFSIIEKSLKFNL